jgi:2-phosphosulfolactate phosphatase
MKLEVTLTPAELPALTKRDLHDTMCVVFDVLRATSTIITALHHGAKAIIPASEISEALAIRGKQPDVLLGGERDGVRICAAQTGGVDFDLGNSPREYTPGNVRAKTIVSTTTNGTRALRACAEAQTVLGGSFLNLAATATFIQKQRPAQILLVCAGTHQNTALEDMLAAGALCEALTSGKNLGALSDSAQVALHAFRQVKSNLAGAIHNSKNAKRLLAIPELRDDVSFCLQCDVFPLVARMEANGMIRGCNGP